MRFLLRVVPSLGEGERFLSSLKSIASSVGVSIKHPRWTSYGALEVDAFAPSAEDFDLFVAATEPLSNFEFTRNLDEAPTFKPKEEVIEEARDYFNAERYWECHEALEPVWRPARGQEKKLVQAIILVCAALVHVQRGEGDVALGIYRRALPQIEWGENAYHGIKVQALRREVERSISKGDIRPFKI